MVAEAKKAKAAKDKEKGKRKGAKKGDRSAGGGISAGGPSATELRTLGDLASISAYCTHGRDAAYSDGGPTRSKSVPKRLEELGDAQLTKTPTRPSGYTAPSLSSLVRRSAYLACLTRVPAVLGFEKSTSWS